MSEDLTMIAVPKESRNFGDRESQNHGILFSVKVVMLSSVRLAQQDVPEFIVRVYEIREINQLEAKQIS